MSIPGVDRGWGTSLWFLTMRLAACLSGIACAVSIMFADRRWGHKYRRRNAAQRGLRLWGWFFVEKGDTGKEESRRLSQRPGLPFSYSSHERRRPPGFLAGARGTKSRDSHHRTAWSQSALAISHLHRGQPSQHQPRHRSRF